MDGPGRKAKPDLTELVTKVDNTRLQGVWGTPHGSEAKPKGSSSTADLAESAHDVGFTVRAYLIDSTRHEKQGIISMRFVSFRPR